MPKVIIDAQRCKGCGLCIAFCTRDNLRRSDGINARGAHPTEVCDDDACTGCKMCVLMCPDVAIRIYREAPKEADSQ